MRSEYSKALRNIVEREMLASPFGWQPEKLKSQYIFPGERVFKHTNANGLLFWCVLVPHLKKEEFTFEVGWSKLDRFPQLMARPSVQLHDKALHLPEYFVRLGTLKFGADRWWQVEVFDPPQNVAAIVAKMQPILAVDAIARVEPLAKDAVATVQSCGVPYLQQVII